jgi:hypothetical protein
VGLMLYVFECNKKMADIGQLQHRQQYLHI